MYKCSSPQYLVIRILIHTLTQAIMHTYVTLEPQGARDLWKHNARFLAVLLVLWSGVWPHVKLVALLFILHTGIKFPKTVRAIEWLGRWAFLDVYFVVLVTLCFSIDPVKACMLIMCEDVGWLQAVPRSGIFLFAFAAVASQCLSRATVRSLWYQVSYASSKKRDDEHKALKTASSSNVVLRSWLAFAFTLLLLLCFLLSQLATLFTVSKSTSLGSFVQLPGPRSYSVLEVWKHMFHEMPNLELATNEFSSLLVLLCAACVTFVPLVRLSALCALCFSRKPVHLLRGRFGFVRDLEHVTSFWCHTSVFSVALLLLIFEIKYLSNQFDAGSIINAAVGQAESSSEQAGGGDLMGNLLSMSIGTIASAEQKQLLDIEIQPNRNVLNAFVLISILADIATWIIRYVFDPGWREDQVAVVVDGDLDEESLPLLGGDDDDEDDGEFG